MEVLPVLNDDHEESTAKRQKIDCDSAKPVITFETAKDTVSFRNYTNSVYQDLVSSHYRAMRTGQSVEYVNRMAKKYTFENGQFRSKYTIREVFGLLGDYVDSSDPDLGLPNFIHNFQTAEGIRRDGHPDWFQLVGLMHDMGKVMFALGGLQEDGQHGTADSPQWGLGGDTWVVGCKIPNCVVFPEFNELSPDKNIPEYSTELGIYEAHCGLDNVKFAYGHDEYMYQMLRANDCKIPEAGYAMVRYHSAYPWHTGGAYRQFMNAKDEEMLEWIHKFNKYDLYTKDEKGLTQTEDELWAYYEPIIAKYFPESDMKLKW